MNQQNNFKKMELLPKLGQWPIPGKALVTAIIFMVAIGMSVALGQVVVHDIIPAFGGESVAMKHDSDPKAKPALSRGDLFASDLPAPMPKRFYETEAFVFALKFTHIHIFSMSGIFILMGGIVLFLNLSRRARIWLIVLPFIGIILDLASIWLKLFIHPVFFWLHIPGGSLFGVIFAIDSILALKQMWLPGAIKGGNHGKQ